jgi:hypothetical protein
MLEIHERKTLRGSGVTAKDVSGKVRIKMAEVEAKAKAANGGKGSGKVGKLST